MKSPFTVPQSWTRDTAAPVPSISSPEDDLHISFVVLEFARSAQETATAAWRILDPAFNGQILQEQEAPSKGWDKTYQIIFATPASESRLSMALVRTLKTRAYVNLIRGTNAGVSRRGAQMMEAISSWKPDGLHEIFLNPKAKKWTSEHSGQLRTFMVSAMNSLGIPGTSIAVVQDGEIVYAEGLGIRSLDRPEPVTSRTKFMIGSATKALTSLLMARLIDEGKIEWSTPIVALLDDFALADPDVTARLQMRHTVSASTGMPRQDFEFIFRHSNVTPETRIGEMRTMRPTTGFGETFQYSNLLVAVGGYAAARACFPNESLEEAFDHAMKAKLFGPLGMHDTVIRPDEALRNDAAAPHAGGFDGMAHNIPLAMERFAYSAAPAGAAWSTATDMARYVLLELASGQLADGERLISEKNLLERRQPGIKIDEKNFYGLGLMISNESGLRVVHHGGNTLGFTADMYFLPDSGFGAVVLTNAYAANAFQSALREKIRELIFGADPTADEMVSAAKTAKSDSLARLHTRLDAEATWISDLLGTYRSAELGNAQITHDETGYWAHFSEWSSRLAGEIQPGGDRLLRLTSPPWAGAMRLLVRDRELELDAAQMRYVFRKEP